MKVTKLATGTSVDTADETNPFQLQPAFDVKAMGRPEGCPVVRSLEQLRLHRALDELGLSCTITDLNDAALLKDQSIREPIIVTTSGTILSGLGRWRAAFLEGRTEIQCIEYQLSEDEALQFILWHHQPQRGWNAFIRIRLALKLEPHFQERALDNMRAGGRYKGSANLPEAQHVDVREDIARLAGVGSRNVSKVKLILQTAHPRLIDALANGTVSIHRARQWCRLPKAKQLEQFTGYTWERTRSKVIRQAIDQSTAGTTGVDLITSLDVLRRQEARQPGSVVLRVSRLQRTVVLISEGLLTDLHSLRGPAPL